MFYTDKLKNLLNDIIDPQNTISLGSRHDAIQYYMSGIRIPICRFYHIVINGVERSDVAVGYSKDFSQLTILLDTEKLVEPFRMKRNKENGCWLVNMYYPEIPNYIKMKAAAKMFSKLKEVLNVD